MLLMFILLWIVVMVYMGLKYMNMDGSFLKHQSITKHYRYSVPK